MSLHKRKIEYRSFDYLGSHFQERFPPAAQLGRVPAAPVPLDAEQEQRAQRVFAEEILISMHEHLCLFPEDIASTPAWVREGRCATAFEGLSHSHWDAVFDNLLDGICTLHSRNGWKWSEVLADLGMRLCDLAHQDLLVHCRGVEDIRRSHQNDQIAWIASIEGCAMIENELDRIEQLYGFGVRALGITYSEANALGSGLREPSDGGLTVFGRQAVERMNRVGMLIDCSHCGDQTTLDVIETSEFPIVLSHIGARALWDSNRLAPDEVLEACAAKGGVIGVEAAPHTTVSQRHPRHTLEAFMEHFEYIKGLVGIDHVAFGPDTVYGDHVGLHHVYSSNLSLAQSRGRSANTAPVADLEAAPVLERVEWVEGIENPTEGSSNIVRWLVAAGYSDDDIRKVVGGNVLRVLEQVWH
jgi:membrane dipeptidase